MPDFYLDYVLAFPGKLDEMASAMVDVAGRGGGNLLGWKHLIGRGGNASNFSAQLSNLDVNVVPIIATDEFGKMALGQFLKGVDLSHVTTAGSVSRTCDYEGEHFARRGQSTAGEPG